jgi:hypothetical protein
VKILTILHVIPKNLLKTLPKDLLCGNQNAALGLCKIVPKNPPESMRIVPKAAYNMNTVSVTLIPLWGLGSKYMYIGIGLPYRAASLCSLALATQFHTRFLESIPRPIAGLKFSTLEKVERGKAGNRSSDVTFGTSLVGVFIEASRKTIREVYVESTKFIL